MTCKFEKGDRVRFTPAFKRKHSKCYTREYLNASGIIVNTHTYPEPTGFYCTVKWDAPRATWSHSQSELERSK